VTATRSRCLKAGSAEEVFDTRSKTPEETNQSFFFAFFAFLAFFAFFAMLLS
jgi:hypothetical protein